jgi:hypothetical protein
MFTVYGLQFTVKRLKGQLTCSLVIVFAASPGVETIGCFRCQEGLGMTAKKL